MTEMLDTLQWRTVRQLALARDGHRCTVSRLLGGACSGPLEVHHIVARSEGGDPVDLDNLGTACKSHHPMWESLRRILARRMAEPPPRCPHRHVSAEARRICEDRLRRDRERQRELVPA